MPLLAPYLQDFSPSKKIPRGKKKSCHLARKTKLKIKSEFKKQDIGM